MSDFNIELAKQLVNSEEQFPVDLEDATIWLNYHDKSTAKRAFLNCSFVENLDYCISTEPTTTGISAIPKQNLVMTAEAFKQWGMMSGTEQGKKVRLYFLECEKVAKQVTSISPDLTQALLKMQEQLNSLVVSQVRLNQLEAKNEELQTASLAHPGCKDVLDKNANCNYSDDLVLTVKQYVNFKNLGDSPFINTLSKRAAQYYRLAKQSDPLTNRRNQVIYKGSDILYLDEALKSILDLD